jgi:hypothetical protein
VSGDKYEETEILERAKEKERGRNIVFKRNKFNVSNLLLAELALRYFCKKESLV